MINLNLHKIIYSLAAIIFCVVIAPSYSFAEDLPNCESIPSGSARCSCGHRSFLSNSKVVICEEGQACRSTSINSGGSYRLEYDCISLKNLGVTGTSAYGGVSVVSQDSHLYNDYYNKLKTGCETGSDTACAPYCKYETKEECLLCPLFAIIFNTVSRITATAVGAFSGSVINVVIIAFGIWLALQILSFVSSIETRDLKDLFQSIITHGFIVMLVVFILHTGVARFFNDFINPIYQTGLSLADTMFSDCEQGKSTLKCSEDDKTIIKNKSSGVNYESNGLPQEMGISIINTMTMMENRVRKFKALGSSLMCQSWKEGVWILPKFIYLFSGLGLWVFSMLIIVGVPFLMVDAVLQLGVAGALLPVAVGGFAFKSTRQYTKKVWETFLNSMFSFLFISIVVLILLGVIQAIAEDSAKVVSGTVETFDSMFTDASSASMVYFKTIMESFNWGSQGFLKLIFTFILAWSVLSMAKEFAGEFASSMSDTSIGSSIGTMAASTAKGMALKAGKPLATRAVKEVGYATKETFKGAARGVRRAVFDRQKYQLDDARQTALKAAQKAGTSAETLNSAQKGKQTTTTTQNGKTVHVENSGKTTVTTQVERGVTSVSTTKNGRKISELREENGVVTKSKYSKDGSRVEVERSQNFTITRRYDKDGNQVGEIKVKANTLAADRLINNPKEEFKKQDLDNLTKGMTDKQKKSTFSAVAQKINKNRINTNNHKGKIISQEVIACDYESGYVEIKKTTSKGEIIFEKIEIDNNKNIAKGSITTISAKGQVTMLTSDGIHNKMEKFRVDRNKINNIERFEDIASNREKDADGKVKKGKVAYGYTKWYRDALEHGLDPREIDEGMFSKEEAEACYAYHVSKGNEMGKAEMGWSFK